MPGVAIVGAGELGGDVAHVLARCNVASTQAAPIERFATAVSGSTDLTTAAGAAIVVVADRHGAGEWQGDNGLLLLKRLSQFGRQAVVICAGGMHRELVERGVRELAYDRKRLFGSAPEALVAAVRAIVALATSSSPADVALTAIGVPPSKIVVPWEEAAIGGLAATSVLDEPARRRLAAKVAPLWPPGPHALAWAVAVTVKAIVGRTRRRVTAFVAPDDSSGRRVRAAALPVRLGPAGIIQVDVPRLNAHDQVALDNAMLL